VRCAAAATSAWSATSANVNLARTWKSRFEKAKIVGAELEKSPVPEARRLWRRAGVWLALLLVLAIALIGAIPDVRHFALRSAGWALVASDSEEPADIIVIAVDAGAAGVLEATDLVHRGIASRVAVFAEPPDPLATEFAKRGLSPTNLVPWSVRVLNALGITQIEVIAQIPNGTEEEGKILPAWCDQKGFGTIIFVSTSDHSRRTRRVLQRSMSGHHTRVLVRYSSYSRFQPDAWWMTRNGIRTEFVEGEKLLYDVLRHPFSG